MQLRRARPQFLRAHLHRLGDLVDLRVSVRQELVQRRVEQADRDRQAAHDLEQFGEVLALHREKLGERGATALLVVGENHLAHRHDPLAVEEHVLGAAKADAFGAERAGGARVRRGLGVGAHLIRLTIRPGHERREIAGHLRLHHRRRAAITSPEPPSMVRMSPFFSVFPPAFMVCPA